MRRISLEEAQAKFYTFLKASEAGEQFVITQNGRDVAVMGPLSEQTAAELAGQQNSLIRQRIPKPFGKIGEVDDSR